MKLSKRNIANAVAKAEKASKGPPKLSKYAIKRAKQVGADQTEH